MAAPEVLEAFDGAIDGAEDADSGEIVPQFLAEDGGEFVDVVAVGAGEEDVDEADERWVGGSSALFDEGFEESFVVVGLGGEDGDMLRGERLDDDAAGALASTGTAGDLGEELEGAFRGAKIGNVEGDVGGNDPDEGDVGKVEALGDHLGADEDVVLTASELGEDFLESSLFAGNVPV